MRLLYATQNCAKLHHMQDMLRGSKIEIVGLNDPGIAPLQVAETGNESLQNARIKAHAYYHILRTPVFACDSALEIKGLAPRKQPGVNVRRVNGKTLDDGQMLEHYAALAKRFGGQVQARYKNAICLVYAADRVYEYDGEDIGGESFYLVSTPHQTRISGFPLDSLSVELASGQYYFDLPVVTGDNSRSKQALGFTRFFEEIRKVELSFASCSADVQHQA